MFTPIQVILLCVLVGVWTWQKYNLQMFYYASVVTMGVLTGLIMGDVQTGMLVGGAMCLMSLGLFGAGGSSVPEYPVGCIAGAAFAIAMGITGTEVSKDAAAMVLSDDNFATIIKAVLNGRNVYRNIMNAIQFLLSGNLAAIFVVLYCSVMALTTPFLPVHLLFINLLTDSLPALAIGMEPADKSLLQNKPRNPEEGILNKKFSMKLLAYGISIAVVTQTAFYIGLKVNAASASTMAFATLTLARLFHGFTCRSGYSIFKIGLKSNKWSVLAFLTGTLLLIAALMLPGFNTLFMVETLSGFNLLMIGILAFLPTFVFQVVRLIKEHYNKK